LIVDEIKRVETLLIDCHGNLPKNEGVGVNMLEYILLLVLNRFPKGSNRLGGGNFDWKDVAGIIAKDQAIELECRLKKRALNNS
jgi:hypothetical protein